jgi:small subunit ribosomal protein S6
MMILDTRGREEDIEKLLEELKKEISGLGIEVQSAEHLGRRDFARQPDVKVPAGNYVQLQLAGPPETGQRLREHFRLNPLVYRILLQGE